jgi:hypothetical protein
MDRRRVRSSGERWDRPSARAAACFGVGMATEQPRFVWCTIVAHLHGLLARRHKRSSRHRSPASSTGTVPRGQPYDSEHVRLHTA